MPDENDAKTELGQSQCARVRIVVRASWGDILDQYFDLTDGDQVVITLPASHRRNLFELVRVARGESGPRRAALSVWARRAAADYRSRIDRWLPWSPKDDGKGGAA